MKYTADRESGVSHIGLPMFRVKVEEDKGESKERGKMLEKRQESSKKTWQFNQ